MVVLPFKCIFTSSTFDMIQTSVRWFLSALTFKAFPFILEKPYCFVINCVLERSIQK